MGSQKTLTIGVTVNLEHYENLRLEVSGEVDSPEDAEDLSWFLDTVLGSFGRHDPATAERVNSYRKRVLQGSTGTAPGGGRSKEVPSPPAVDLTGKKPENGPIAPEIPQASAAASSAAPGVPAVTCASCGAPVSPAEQKMSQLFTSRTLCRVCMKNL